MSIQAMSAVLALPGDLLSPSQRLVLISLANHANKDGQHSYPGRATITDETGLGLSTVSRALAQLRTAGLIRVARYPGRDGNGHYEGAFIYDLLIPGLSTETSTEFSPPLAKTARPLLKSRMGSSSTHSQPPSRSESVTVKPLKRFPSQSEKGSAQSEKGSAQYDQGTPDGNGVLRCERGHPVDLEWEGECPRCENEKLDQPNFDPELNWWEEEE